MVVLALLAVGVIVEIAVLITVGQAIGVLPTLAVLIAATVIGLVLVRREGGRAMAAFTAAVRTRRVPHQEVADGMLIVGAGLLIMVPGFVSDLAALTLLFPPTRRVVSRRLARRAELRVARFEHHRRFGPTTGVVDGEVIEGEVIDLTTDTGATVDPEVVDGQRGLPPRPTGGKPA